MTVPKIKAFFQLNTKKMGDILEMFVLDKDDFENSTKDTIDLRQQRLMMFKSSTVSHTKLSVTLSIQNILKF